jgi:hypothetical protein
MEQFLNEKIFITRTIVKQVIFLKHINTIVSVLLLVDFAFSMECWVLI